MNALVIVYGFVLKQEQEDSIVQFVSGKDVFVSSLPAYLLIADGRSPLF